MLEKIKFFIHFLKAKRIIRYAKKKNITESGREFLYYIIDKHINGHERESIEQYEDQLMTRINSNKNDKYIIENYLSLFQTEEEKKWFAAVQYATIMIAATPPANRAIALNLIEDYRTREMITRSIA